MNEVNEFREIIQQLKHGMRQVMEKKMDRNDLRKEGALQILQLKCLNERSQLNLKSEWDKTENAKTQLNIKRQGFQALQYRINRLKQQIEEEKSVKAENMDIISVSQFLEDAPPRLIEKSKLSDHDQNLARLEFELMQRKEMNTLLKTKQEDLLRLKNEIIEKESNLTVIEPGLKQLLESTKPLLAGMELQLDTIGDELSFESFDEYDLSDSLMCLFRQCKNFTGDILVKYKSRDLFEVHYQKYIFEFTHDMISGCVFVRSNTNLDSVGLCDFGTSKPNMFGQTNESDPDFEAKIKDGFRCYRWLQNICGLELILKEEELLRVPNFEKFIEILA